MVAVAYAAYHDAAWIRFEQYRQLFTGGHVVFGALLAEMRSTLLEMADSKKIPHPHSSQTEAASGQHIGSSYVPTASIISRDAVRTTTSQYVPAHTPRAPNASTATSTAALTLAGNLGGAPQSASHLRSMYAMQASGSYSTNAQPGAPSQVPGPQAQMPPPVSFFGGNNAHSAGNGTQGIFKFGA
ncbi:uncharacterized protein K460DRAFT_117295 [Cucurbitaria berberidis CBS 394.84]|uniref:Uncharacterized protein n=1 Tax=Cucurbitaria berberidis CBS 394.84 TaxID=1168544 RepID=A0A9P4GI68_9PLEO|nr:uncharacterized protein K460DRAFT_117295 [Cucurbitaria berberidis CBS 394.84]KAF1845924.1 hypothetical protein K460DRAFT_117295 [Cucurbitaria berberidis CBS 394.84]